MNNNECLTVIFLRVLHLFFIGIGMFAGHRAMSYDYAVAIKLYLKPFVKKHTHAYTHHVFVIKYRVPI